jgi:FkbH-like protein
MFARLTSDLPPKKGLITDLDDTFWKGIVGEVGVGGISWTLDRGAQIHGLYQQLLTALAGAGVLIGAASKNDPAVVEAAFARTDLILTKDDLFPIEASWEPKSRSVARILRAWNISADSVVFVDDSAMELAEVATAHPGIECLQFPTHDWQAAYHLLEQLRDRFGKSRLLDEDLLRAQSLRRSAGDASPSPLPSYERFLDDAKPEISVEYCDSAVDPRALELINKTNQFNLNGKRQTQASLLRHLQNPGSFMMVASYKDKYGPLGKIAALCGTCLADAVHIDTWVMSCRAFSRRIEYWCMQELFEHFAADQVTFDFQPTERNSPLREFLANVLGESPSPGCKLARADFQARCSRPGQALPETIYA